LHPATTRFDRGDFFWAVLKTSPQYLGVSVKALLLVLFFVAWAWAAPQDLKFEVVDSTPGSGTCTLVVHNPGSQGERFTLPAGSVLSHPTQQDVMTLEKKPLAVPPKGKVQCRVSVLCIGKRSEPAQGQDYRWVESETHPQALQAQKLWEVCQKLQSQGDLPPMPMLPAAQARVVTQYALWHAQGDFNKSDLKKLLTTCLAPAPEKEPEVEKATDNIWEGVDLTLKTSKGQTS